MAGVAARRNSGPEAAESSEPRGCGVPQTPATRPHEEATIRAFIAPACQTRWLKKLASAKHRRAFLDRLNHCPDIDERHASALAPGDEVVALLSSRGAPTSCFVTSDVAAIDGREMPLSEAINRTETAGFGTLITCIPGHLGYYYDESGARRWLLEWS